MPETLRSAACDIPESQKCRVEELRLRAGCEPKLLLPEGERSFFKGHRLRQAELISVLELASRSSLHSVTEQLSQGYLSSRGGVRIGVCGTAVMDKGIKALRSFSSLSVRIPRQIRQAGGRLLPELTEKNCSVLIISEPGGGKTTFLRELVRTGSEMGKRIALADERCEIASVWEGEPQFDVGPCTDVLSSAPKAEAAMLLLRAMNPQFIALDEITRPGDVEAIEHIGNCGVHIYATAHAGSFDELNKRPLYRRILDSKVFECAVLIKGRGSERNYRVMEL